MSTQMNAGERQTIETPIGDRITYGAVHLDVVDEQRSLAFWRDLIGLGELPSPPGESRLGVDGRALVVLHPGANGPAGRGHAGLYHLALHVPDSYEFARALVRIGAARVPQSPTDHVFSKATYLHDPDGIVLEITLETPERYRSIEIGPGTTLYMVDSEGQRRAPTEPLDVAAAIAPLGDGDAGGALSGGSYIGHVHLHVPDLQAAHSFYRDVIGFSEHTYMTQIGMADLSAGGLFPHRLAINNWHGPGAVQAAPGTAGMRHYELILRDQGELEELAGRASELDPGAVLREDRSVSLTDPAGNEIVVSESRA
jgi:catechol 2,3-dioxygenase